MVLSNSVAKVPDILNTGVVRAQNGSGRTDTVDGQGGSSAIADASILASDFGNPVTGTSFIPANSYVGTVSVVAPTNVTAATTSGGTGPTLTCSTTGLSVGQNVFLKGVAGMPDGYYGIGAIGAGTITLTTGPYPSSTTPGGTVNGSGFILSSNPATSTPIPLTGAIASLNVFINGASSVAVAFISAGSGNPWIIRNAGPGVINSGTSPCSTTYTTAGSAPIQWPEGVPGGTINVPNTYQLSTITADPNPGVIGTYYRTNYAGSGNFTLPTSPTVGAWIQVKNVANNTITFVGTIDGNTAFTLTQYQAVMLVYNGTSWDAN